MNRRTDHTYPVAVPAAVLLIILAAVSFSPATAAAADLEGPRQVDRDVVGMVVELLNRDHLSQRDLDDEVSQRALKMFLEKLDPMKMYLHQSDVDQFMKHQDKLDDMIKEGDVQLAFTILARYLQRLDEQVALTDQLLDQQFDFSVDEELITDRDLRRYPRDAADAREKWRKRIKYDLLVQKNDKQDDNEAREKLRRRYRYFKTRMDQFDNDELLEMYLNSVTQSYDPHTTFMSKSSLASFRIALSLRLQGIGAAIRSEDGETIVTRIVPGSAADKHGKLKADDRIISVGEGADGEMVDIIGRKLDDVLQMIRGKAGTTVRLGVVPSGSSEVETYTIVRARIEVKDSEARADIINEGKRPDGSPVRIGVIALPSFYMDIQAADNGQDNYKSTSRDVRKILERFKQQKVDIVIFDLRQNGGGSLVEAINCTGLFIDKGPVVQVQDHTGRVDVYGDLDPGEVWGGPLVVVTSKLSASACEVFSGALQDYRRALIVGDDATHGKGTVQSLLILEEQKSSDADPPDLGALKITIQQFYRPHGDSTQARGVRADIVLPSITTHMDVSEMDHAYAMDFDRVPATEISEVDLVSDDISDQLRKNSDSRRSQSPPWQKLRKNIARYNEQKLKKSITLNEEKFFARLGELEADAEEEKVLDEEDKVVQRDYYFNEVMAIAVDYLNELEKRGLAQSP